MMQRCRAAVLVLLSCALVLCSREVRAEDGITLSKDGVQIAYSVYGTGEPTLVFIHGWCGSRSLWADQVPYFSAKYRVVTIDLAGHGASGKERKVYTIKAFGEDVAAVVNKVGASDVILIGHSMSGEVIFEAAAMLPAKVIALIGIDTMQDFAREYDPQKREEMLVSFRKDFKKTTDSFVRGMFPKGTDPKIVEKVAGSLSAVSPAVGISAMDELMRTSYIRDLPKPDLPVWCLNTDLWPTNVAGNQKYIPGFTARIMPGLGHFPMVEAPEAFNRQLDEMIGEIVTPVTG